MELTFRWIWGELPVVQTSAAGPPAGRLMASPMRIRCVVSGMGRKCGQCRILADLV
jgi:hypothetical protein